MSDYRRPFHVWHLDVEYPPTEPWPKGCVPGNEASYAWAEEHDGHFWFPRHTRYLSERTANKRAALLRTYGATVTVVRSNPVTYPILSSLDGTDAATTAA